jgi:mRNA interferase HigB
VYPDSKQSLESWYKVIIKSKYDNLTNLRLTFSNSIDKVDNLFVFNIGGNKYRLIAAIHFKSKIVFIRNILTHSEYDKNKWRRSK